MPSKELTAALEAARAAADVIGAHYQKNLTVRTKPDDSPVTAADVRAEEIIRAHVRCGDRRVVRLGAHREVLLIVRADHIRRRPRRLEGRGEFFRWHIRLGYGYGKPSEQDLHAHRR